MPDHFHIDEPLCHCCQKDEQRRWDNLKKCWEIPELRNLVREVMGYERIDEK